MVGDKLTTGNRPLLVIDPDDVDACIADLHQSLERGMIPLFALPDRLDGLVPSDEHSTRGIANALNRIDKELWSRSISRKHLDRALLKYCSLNHFGELTRSKWPQMVYRLPFDRLVTLLPELEARVGERNIHVECADGAAFERLRNSGCLSTKIRAYTRQNHHAGGLIDTEIDLSTADSIREYPRLLRDTLNDIYRRAGEHQISLRVGPAAMEQWNQIVRSISQVSVNQCSVFLNIPFWSAGRAVSALDWRNHVDALRDLCIQKGWVLTGGHAELESVGLQVGQQYPELRDMCYVSGPRDPLISVVVAIYNAGEFIDQFVQSLLSQQCDKPFEIILVDDGSSDNTWPQLERIAGAGTSGIGIRLIRLQRTWRYEPGTFTFRTGAARQKGCEWAKADRFLFLDPDQLIEPRCVAEHLEMGLMGFDVVVGVRDNPDASIHRRVRSRIRHLGSVDPLKDWWPIFFTGNSSVSRAAFAEVGGFDEVLQYWGLDDRDLGYRLQLAGARCWHTPRARVTHFRGALSGGGLSRSARKKSCRFQMEVLYRKYLDGYILDTYKPFWEI